MNTISILLAVQPRLYRELLQSHLSVKHRFNIIPCDNDEFEIARNLQELLDHEDFDLEAPVVVIASLDESDAVPAQVSRLLLEFPEISFISISTTANRVRTYRLRVEVVDQECSMNELVSAVFECARNFPPF